MNHAIENIISKTANEHVQNAAAAEKALCDIEDFLSTKLSWKLVKKVEPKWSAPYIIAENDSGTRLVMTTLFLTRTDEEVVTDELYDLSQNMVEGLPKTQGKTYLGVITNTAELENTFRGNDSLMPVNMVLCANEISLEFFEYDSENKKYPDSTIYSFAAFVNGVC